MLAPSGGGRKAYLLEDKQIPSKMQVCDKKHGKGHKHEENADSYEGAMAGVDINTLTMEQYLALSQENQAPGVVKPEIEGNEAILLRVFSFTLTGTAKRLVDRLTLGAVNTWDLLKKAHHPRLLKDLKTSTTSSR
ncbi:hypothetical protein Tco_1368494 [Tanacetum coccineum]